MSGRTNRRRIPIEFGNCDPAQIVYDPNDVVWIDRSTHHLFESVGMPPRDLRSRLGLQMPLVDLNVKFLGPGWGDESIMRSGRIDRDRLAKMSPKFPRTRRSHTSPGLTAQSEI